MTLSDGDLDRLLARVRSETERGSDPALRARVRLATARHEDDPLTRVLTLATLGAGALLLGSVVAPLAAGALAAGWWLLAAAAAAWALARPGAGRA
jgi:hypothetical protein